ncbi:MAG: DNA gyrase subunit A [Verrucomicrobia bacterium]|jgi:DNA gyrase subunit A|nr:DNA gyrase subunit A [Verrucomicrobiota bacterium]OQC25824.1 MAG: DNA gyrase subunit A [Verrucomicrobia bacterium ADurb.Bin063]HNW07053.1 DNA gyrase subunit A [Verrucomicrobiota bacterium]HNZ75774.1 DNA gyrase subunit A [Verrucomicrobiota bacterium]HOC50556.1 DNA gyrase subunit A [Verrucomicrobiota bacterium]
MPDDTPSNDPRPALTPAYAAHEKINKINVAEEIKNSFLDYSMSVIISRALPDVRDGLKPSQRRILYAMHDLGVMPNRKHLKCAKIVGETMGNYHPHGDLAIYPTLVHMAQPWAMRERLVEGQGNFGSVEGDPPAAMRYTEARLAPLGAVLMEDMDKDTVDFVPNYDETRTEPTVFPAAFPNLLVNGGTGIAVGMATNMPPHNLGEIVDGICAQIDKPDITLRELMQHVKGPDFPTGCMICGLEGIKNYFTDGRGSLKVRGKVGLEEIKGGREQIIITEIPFNVNRAVLVERIATLVNEKIITDITGVRDESDENTRIVIEIKRDAVPKVVINNLYQYTALESSFSVNALAIDHGRPKTLGLKDLIGCYIEHRREVVIRRTRFELRQAEERAEILEGYLIALSNLDEFIRIIRHSHTREEAKIKLLAFDFTRAQVETLGILIRSEARLLNGRYSFSEAQANAILELRLYQLTGLEIDKVRAEYRALIARIKDLLDILAKEERVLGIIKTELQAIKAKYATPRVTELVPDEGEIAIEDLIANEGVIITLTHTGLIKRTNISSYRAQRRGGKGVIGMTTREGPTEEDVDFIEHLFTASTHDYLMFFTNTGRVYAERVHEIPDMGRAAKGRSIANLLELKAGETIAALIRIEARTGPNKEDITWQQPGFLFFATQQGTVKKTPLTDFANVRKDGIIAIRIEPGDALIDVKLTSGQDQVVLITRDGMSIRFAEEDVRPMGRPAAGVRGINLEKADAVVALALAVPDATLLVAGENGIGKRTPFDLAREDGTTEPVYRLQSRGGKGIITMKANEKTGAVVGALTVQDGDEVMLITAGGQLVRTYVKDIRETGRNAQGVRLINLAEGDQLQAIAPVISEQQENGAEE